MSVLIVGSIALDTVKTPVEEHADLLGGSASYASLGASFFSPVKLVGIVGDDFPQSEFDFWKSRQIDATGVQRVSGKTFRWSGEYAWDMNTRETRSTALNVFEHFRPDLPSEYRETEFVLLANIAPALQSHVLDQMKRPRFVVADTMDLWIETQRGRLSTIDLFDRDFVLLTAEPGALWRVAAETVSLELGVPVVSHLISEPEWHDLYGISPRGAVLVRPDGHIAWRRRTLPRPAEPPAQGQFHAALATAIGAGRVAAA